MHSELLLQSAFQQNPEATWTSEQTIETHKLISCD